MQNSKRTPFVKRLIKAAKLDADLYEEVEADTKALNQALLVVVLCSVATGIGVSGRIGPRLILSVVTAGIVGWGIWALITFVIGARWLRAPGTLSNLGEVLRTTGFATAPGLLAVLGYAPAFTGFIVAVTQIWILAAFVVAIRQAFDYRGTWRAIAVCSIGGFVYAGLIWALTL